MISWNFWEPCVCRCVYTNHFVQSTSQPSFFPSPPVGRLNEHQTPHWWYTTWLPTPPAPIPLTSVAHLTFSCECDVRWNKLPQTTSFRNTYAVGVFGKLFQTHNPHVFEITFDRQTCVYLIVCHSDVNSFVITSWRMETSIDFYCFMCRDWTRPLNVDQVRFPIIDRWPVFADSTQSSECSVREVDGM
jgi:hypothetical protein